MNLFFEMTEFYSDLKQKFVSKDDCDNSKYLYLNLKMRNLSDMNDLYNAQDVILLYEIFENRFPTIQDVFKFNPRIRNSASTLSRCIQRDRSKIVISLPNSNNVIKTFEKTLTVGFKSVNTRLAFDTEKLMPNILPDDYN